MDDNATKWMHVYNMKGGLGDWPTFVAVVEAKFEAYDYRKAIQDLLSLKQEGTVEEYTKKFEVA
jgi:hypothetical protein